ncbi:transcriptional regulator GutM [Streptococcus halotolerans]|uniref:transcriptional regulator GutM n=1 Tax=Streptococcus halotolerans TaxID=1814128 RepID=UPI0007894F5F|nr:transcriptional regulator GutM [Streptococcus halotolerans]
MSPVIVLTITIAMAYIFQIFLGIKQIKHFNTVYAALLRKGRVAIGRRSGKFKSGTVVMFAINKDGIILDAKKIQGVTVGARFKSMPQYLDQDLHYLDHYNPLVRKENKLTQIAIEDARNVFLTIEAGTYKEAPKHIPMIDWGLQVKTLLSYVKLNKKSL